MGKRSRPHSTSTLSEAQRLPLASWLPEILPRLFESAEPAMVRTADMAAGVRSVARRRLTTA